MPRSKKVMMLFDLSEPPPKDQNYVSHFEREEWKTERDVYDALRKNGYSVMTIGVYDSFETIANALHQHQPDIVFNMMESFRNERSLEPLVAGTLDLMGVAYTGASPEALMLCKNKGLTKKLLSFHRIKTPKFMISYKNRPLRKLRKLQYPVFVKPLGLEASDGISKDSFAETENAALDRVGFIHENLNKSALIEEYIDGREIYVPILGLQRSKIFSPRELLFKNLPKGEPRFATSFAKWNDDYRKKWGIDTYNAELSDELKKKILHQCQRAYRILGIEGYARIDLRISPTGEIYILEVNPNPHLAKDEDFALSANHDQVRYPELIDQIVKLGLRKHQEKRNRS